MDPGQKQEILEVLREIVEEFDAFGMAAAMPFGRLITDITVAAGQETRSISDAQFLEAARSMLSDIREQKERRRTEPRVMWISCVDQDGNQLSEPEKVIIPAPVHMPENGLAHLTEYVSQVYDSGAASSSLIIMTEDQNRAVSIYRRKEEKILLVVIDWRQHPQEEQAIRQLIADRGLVPTQDHLSGNGDVMDASRMIAVPCGENAAQATDLCGTFLRQIYGVTESEGLLYRFQERL